ncbi:MAG: hypothetical protein E6G02_09235 [Actinobacteria bacterium]|nr:MAG: hypothetical protein E6G02_09235 [Actinomycetota bacterium]
MSRIESARRRAGGVKRALAVLAATGLVVVGVLARATDPGQAARTSQAAGSSSSTVTSSESESSDSDDYSIAPSTSQPQVQTHVS